MGDHRGSDGSAAGQSVLRQDVMDVILYRREGDPERERCLLAGQPRCDQAGHLGLAERGVAQAVRPRRTDNDQWMSQSVARGEVDHKAPGQIQRRRELQQPTSRASGAPCGPPRSAGGAAPAMLRRDGSRQLRSLTVTGAESESLTAARYDSDKFGSNVWWSSW
jgi:hypothetical protein